MNGAPQLLEMASRALEKRNRFDWTIEILLSFPKPNYVDPVTRGPELYIVNSMFFTLMVSCLSLRLYARLFIRRWFGWDDFFIVLALVGAIGVTICVMLGTHDFGWDRHIWDVRTNLIEPSGKILFASKILWSFTSNSVRASVTCLYYRLLSNLGMNRCRWVLHVNSVFIFGLFMSQVWITVFACRPIKTVWTYPLILNSKCINHAAGGFALAVVNTFSEAVVAILPLPVIFALDMAPHQRRMIICMLCGGFLVVAVGCVRCYFYWQTIATFDPSWWAMPHWIASEVEIDIAIICSCVPAITPVLQRMFRGDVSAIYKVNLTQSKSICPSGPKSRMTFLKLKGEPSETTLSSFRIGSSAHGTESFPRTLDLEGIRPDGYGYTVTINTGRGTKVRRRWDIRKKEWHYYPEQEVSDVEEVETTNPPRKLSIFSQASFKHKRSGSGPRASDSETRILDEQKQAITYTQEVFPAPLMETGDFRNSHLEDTSSRYEEDIEIAMQVPEAAVSDWSMFEDDFGHTSQSRALSVPEAARLLKKVSGAKLPSSPLVPTPSKHRRRSSSYGSQRFSIPQRHSADSIRPKTGSGRTMAARQGSKCYENIRMGILPSPSTTKGFDFPLRPPSPVMRSTLHTPSPPQLPLAARYRSGSSPATNPVNSSHRFVTSDRFSRTQHAPERNEGVGTESSHESHQDIKQYEEVYAASQADNWKKTSVRSSLRAENGSSKSTAVTTQRKKQVMPRLRFEENSDDDLDLPMQQPSPRNSTAYGPAVQQQKWSTIRSSIPKHGNK